MGKKGKGQAMCTKTIGQREQGGGMVGRVECRRQGVGKAGESNS